ncbi:MAG: hypothetical protein PWP19_1654, partial [Thermococcaceae archaeon]|nr:hypothetical protein [Thermococcaceae archaeon]
ASPQGSIIRDYLKITENKRIQKFHLSLPMKQPNRRQIAHALSPPEVLSFNGKDQITTKRTGII